MLKLGPQEMEKLSTHDILEQGSPRGGLWQREQDCQPLSLLHGTLVSLDESVKLRVGRRQRNGQCCQQHTARHTGNNG
jgi:hypothetical protein